MLYMAATIQMIRVRSCPPIAPAVWNGGFFFQSIYAGPSRTGQPGISLESASAFRSLSCKLLLSQACLLSKE